MYVPNDNNGPYFDALPLVSPQDGRWFETAGDPTTLTVVGKLVLQDAGSVSGDLWVEFAADRDKALAPKLVLPDGCLHTEQSTITLATRKLALASVVNGSIFGLNLSYPVCGYMRLRWNPTGVGSVVAGVNTFTMHVQMGRLS